MYQESFQDPLLRAASFVDQASDADGKYLDLVSLLGTDSFNEPTVGGNEQNEYPMLNFSTPELSPLKVKVLPVELQERLKQLQCNCQMGIFAEINRAWLTIDNEIYLWTYDDGNDIAYYDRVNELILSAALIHPKPNIFQSRISHLLCLATPVEILLLGVTFSNSSSNYVGERETSFKDLQILPDPLYTVATDNVHMTSILGTRSGRIFTTGKDGCLYEIDYKGDQGWFGGRSCRKINHSTSFSSYIVPSFITSYFSEEDPLIQLCYEESRNLLFARSQKSNLQVFYLGRDGTKFNKIAYLNHEKAMKRISRNFDQSKVLSIVHISSVPASDSERIHLVAVTSSGARLYYTTRGFSDTPQDPASAPNCLNLLHVRLPPGFLGGAGSPQRFSYPSFALANLSSVHTAAYVHGTYLMSCSNSSDDGDNLWVISCDTFPFANLLSESYERTQLAGKVWSIEEIRTQNDQLEELVHMPYIPISGDSDHQGDGSAVQGPYFPDPPAVVTQLYSANKKFAIVSSVGVVIAVKLSPCEQLQNLLLKHGADSEQIRSYFSLLKEQAMTNCLALMSARSASHLQVNSLASRAYSMYKWDQGFMPNFGQTLTPDQMSTPMPGQVRRNLNFQVTPVQPYQQSNQSMFGQSSTLNYSCTSLNHRSLYLYLARLLRPVWIHRLVTVLPHRETGEVLLTSRLTSDQIACVLQKCLDFKSLLQNNPSLLTHVPTAPAAGHSGVSAVLPGDSFSIPRNTSLRAFELEADEAISLRNLESLLDMSCQCLSMWKILADHQFHVVASKLKKEQQDLLAGVSFSQLLLSNRSLCKQLVATLVDFYIDDNAATDIVSSRLRESCPQLYSLQDQAQTKGNECLKLAKTSGNPAERRKLTDTAIQQYKLAIASTTPPSTSAAALHQQQQLNSTTAAGATNPDLPSMCSRLASLGAYTGLVDLVLTAAARRDPNSLALHYYVHSKPRDDFEGAKFYTIRCDCYKSMLESLDYLASLSSGEGSSVGGNDDGLGKMLGTAIGSFISPFFSGEKKDVVATVANGYVLSADEASREMEEMIRTIMTSDDKMAHFALFEWMSARGMTEKLLDLPSPHLEQYLKLESNFDFQLQQQQQDQQSDGPLSRQRDVLDLLASYYIKEKNFSAAARILDRLAVKPGGHMNLKDRLNYMSRAALCLQSSATRADGEFMHEVQDKVEVILLQTEVMKSIEKSTSRSLQNKQEAIRQLNSQLFDISELFSRFAIPFELSTCKLAIIHSSGHRDANVIESLWREIIDKELHSSTGQDPKQRMDLVRILLTTLGKIYLKTENYFPLVFLVKHLEQVSVTNGFDEADRSFMARSFIEVGVTFQQLHDAYEKLFRLKDSFWKNNGKTYHLVEVDLFLMENILEQILQTKFIVPEKKQTITKCLDGVSFYLVELQADIRRDESLVRKLKDIQIRAERAAK